MDLTQDDTLLHMKVKATMRDRNRAKELAAISKLTEKIIMKKIQLQLQNNRPITSTNPDVSDEEYLKAQHIQLQEEQDYEANRLDNICKEKGYKDKTDYTFITINPENQNIPIDELQPQIDKIIDKTKWIRDSEYAYVFEQRGKTLADTHGLHCHMLIKTNDKPAHEVRREIFNKLGNLVNVEKVKKDFKRVNYREGPVTFDPTLNPENRIKYMLDWKKCPDKHIKQIVDNEYRTKYNIDKIYYSGELLSQLIIGHQECHQNANIPVNHMEEDATKEETITQRPKSKQ